MKNLTFKILLLPILFFVLNFAACKKDSGLAAVEATVINAGAVAADGCGWVVKIGDTNYSPNNLDSKYEETELKVIITYKVLSTKFQCGWGQKIDEIEIVSIRKK